MCNDKYGWHPVSDANKGDEGVVFPTTCHGIDYLAEYRNGRWYNVERERTEIFPTHFFRVPPLWER